MISFRKNRRALTTELTKSLLLDQDNFYPKFFDDIQHAQHEIIIESPFIGKRRISQLLPLLIRAVERGVKVIINTKPPSELDGQMHVFQAEQSVSRMQEMGVSVLFTGGHHRKLAIIDRRVLYEGSLNILSQNDSCEVMRRIDSALLSKQMIEFIGIKEYIC